MIEILPIWLCVRSLSHFKKCSVQHHQTVDELLVENSSELYGNIVSSLHMIIDKVDKANTMWRNAPPRPFYQEDACLTVSSMHSCLNSSPERRRRTYTIPSEPCRLNLESSEKMTLSHSSRLHLECSFAQVSRCFLTCSVSCGFFLGRLAFKPYATNRFRIVLRETSTPLHTCHSSFKVRRRQKSIVET